MAGAARAGGGRLGGRGRRPVAAGLLADELRAIASGRGVVLDEVQRFIEERGLRFVLCGSSARKPKRAGVNLLAGRALHRSMHPFLPEELGAALGHGLLPLVWDAQDRDETPWPPTRSSTSRKRSRPRRR